MLDYSFDDFSLNPDLPFSQDPARMREITRLLIAYKEHGGSREAERLLALFSPYLHNWLAFLTGRFRVGGPYALFLRNPRFRRIPGDARSKHSLLVRSLRPQTKEDLTGEVALAFLKACTNSESVAYGLPYFLAERVFELIRDPSDFGGRCSPLIDSIESNGELGGERVAWTSEPPTEVGERDDLTFAFELRGAPVDLGNAPFSDLVRVYQRGDGLVGAVLNRDWVGGLTVGVGGEDAFQALTPPEREILLRFYVTGQKHAEIAPAMNISARHSRTLLARARKALSVALAEGKTRNP